MSKDVRARGFYFISIISSKNKNSFRELYYYYVGLEGLGLLRRGSDHEDTFAWAATLSGADLPFHRELPQSLLQLFEYISFPGAHETQVTKRFAAFL